MKKKSGWVGFGIGYDGKIRTIGPYATKHIAQSRSYICDNFPNKKPPKPVKIEWEEK